VQWLRSLPQVDASRVMLGGFSAGGAVAFEASVELQRLGEAPHALALLDAVPWPRTTEAARHLHEPLRGGTLLLESEPSAYNHSLAFRKEVLSALPEWKAGQPTVMAVPGSNHIDVEDADAKDNEPWGKLLWGEPQVEKTLVFQELLEGFVQEAVRGPSAGTGKEPLQYFPGVLNDLVLSGAAMA